MNKKINIHRLLKHIMFKVFARVLTRFSHKTEQHMNKAFQSEDVVLYFEDLITQFMCCSVLPLVKNLFKKGYDLLEHIVFNKNHPDLI